MLLLGPEGVPPIVPAPPELLQALESVNVTHSDSGPSGFQLGFRARRDGPGDALDYPVAASPLLRPFTRVCVVVAVGGTPTVLIDGVVTRHELKPEGGRRALFTLTGEDATFYMGRERRVAQHPSQPEAVIAGKLLLPYAIHGVVPCVVPPPFMDVPLLTDWIPTQDATDLEYLQRTAERFAYEFRVTPGPLPGTSTAYWGPPVVLAAPQPALTLDMGPLTNVQGLEFSYDATRGEWVDGEVQDRVTNRTFPVRTFLSTRVPLALVPHWVANHPRMRTVAYRGSGESVIQALARAQAQTDRSLEGVVTATGTLETARYGGILQPRALVGVRGAGLTHDGLWLVRSVTHAITRGSYTQSFQLERDGSLSTLPVVRT